MMKLNAVLTELSVHILKKMPSPKNGGFLFF